MPTSSDIRNQFIQFFVDKHQHAFVPSSPVVPHNDPTLLFANAGMNQFKPYFLGAEKPEHTRVANTQKCIRAGGKHNDLEDVGKDTYHHTFFEMLGNWSFGDYFKKEAIDWAWELLVKVWKLDPERLHATYFEGDASEGLEPDLEAKKLWEQYLPAERIHPGNKKDNFWEMGDTGPCGPCSEIHIDRTSSKNGGSLVNAGDARVMEIWNLVFIQFNRNQDGRLTPLPAKHVDTGMGFERICAVIESRDKNYDPAIGNYDTDVFLPLFDAIQKVTGARAYSGKLDDEIDTAYRVLGDHIRTLTFALTDGATPGNEGRSYVLRRILRRAVRYGWQTLNVKEPFFYKLVRPLVDHMADAFPELKKHPEHVEAVIKEEEESFIRTIDRGITLFEQAASRATNKTISADDAFTLYDTFGFPLDLTQLMAEERGMAVDTAGFDKLMNEARERSRASSAGGDAKAQLTEIIQRDALPDTQFVGYDSLDWSGQTAVRVYDLGGDVQALVTDATPFYAEQGGQVGDTGTITLNIPTTPPYVFHVIDTQKIGAVYFHLGQFNGNAPTPGSPIQYNADMHVDPARREKIMANHTTTHVMNRALRKLVNDRADQKGSLVDADKLRFDFSHSAAIGPEQAAAVEQMVNADIDADLPVHAGQASQKDALNIHGLRAVFGEKYPPVVRVVAIGETVEDLLKTPDNAAWAERSIELCGGTHLPSTGRAKRFAIVSEEAVGKGVRRITALTHDAAQAAVQVGEQLLQRAAGLSEAPLHELETHVSALSQAMETETLPLAVKHQLRGAVAELTDRIKAHQKAAGAKQAEAAVEQARELADAADGEVIVAELPGADGNALRAAMDVIRKKRPDAAMLLAAASDDKVALLAAVPQPMIARGLKAGDWVKAAAQVVGGGGGRPDMAQAGGKDPAKLPEALEVARTFAAEKI